jgi:protocatechuate 3,4-dioxygenase alpha subunit
VPDADGKLQAPHLLLAVFARGMLRHLYTRIYFGDEELNASDPVLALVPADRRTTMIAQLTANEPRIYLADIRLQGDGEIVFFDI